jgi:Ca2+-binding RTX toxin-like protein
MMATVAALQAFDMFSLLDLSALGELTDDFAFLDNVDFALLGNVFEDVAAYQFTTDTAHLAAFGGTDFAFINGIPVSGTVTGMALTNGSLADGLGGQELVALISGFSVSTSDLAKAVASTSSKDDVALLTKMFAGADRFDLSEGNDFAFGLGGADKMFGNGGNDILIGGTGNDSLSGGNGNDGLEGGKGEDKLLGGGGFDTAFYDGEAAGQLIDLGLKTKQANGDTLSSIEALVGSKFGDVFTAAATGSSLFGEAGSDTLFGRKGADILDGGLGQDSLTGGAGKDVFVFDDAAGLKNADLITDFKRGSDKIGLSSTIFGKLAQVDGHLAPSAFVSGAMISAAQDASDRLIYNTTSGVLLFDPDGTGSKAAQVLCQLGLDLHPALTAADIVLI